MVDLTFTESMELVARFFEAVGAAGTCRRPLLAAWLGVRSLSRSRDPRAAYQVLRRSFGGAIILGVEVLIAADLVRTVAIAPTIENVVSLGIIVLIRTVLSLSLEAEIEASSRGGAQRRPESVTSLKPPDRAAQPTDYRP